jgi:hypothetical protein
MKWVVLNKDEIALLDKQDPATARGGGSKASSWTCRNASGVELAN